MSVSYQHLVSCFLSVSYQDLVYFVSYLYPTKILYLISCLYPTKILYLVSCLYPTKILQHWSYFLRNDVGRCFMGANTLQRRKSQILQHYIGTRWAGLSQPKHTSNQGQVRKVFIRNKSEIVFFLSKWWYPSSHFSEVWWFPIIFWVFFSI